MISWLRGRVINLDGTEVTLNTGNIGYAVTIGENRLLQMGIQLDQEVEMVIQTIVKEDDLQLYGFSTFFERKLFDLMMSVSGIGPKAAMNILDSLNSEQIVVAIQSGDFHPFLRISGIGKKTAQRIILDLQGKLDASFLAILENVEILENKGKTTTSNPDSQYKILEDAKSALSNLGFSEREADRVIRQHIKPELSLDEIIRKSLADLRQ